MDGLRQRWSSLAPRERRALGLGAAALVAILFYFLVHQPIHARHERLQAAYQAEQQLQAYLQQARAELQRLGVHPAALLSDAQHPEQALFALADDSARQAGLGNVLRRVEPSGPGAARVSFERIAFDELVRWLALLHGQHGISATVVTVRRSELDGRVDAQLLLERPGR